MKSMTTPQWRARKKRSAVSALTARPSEAPKEPARAPALCDAKPNFGATVAGAQGAPGAAEASESPHIPNIANIPDVLGRAVARSGLTHDSFLRALTSGAFGRIVAWSQLDLERLLLAAERMGLDPAGGEIYALPRPEQAQGGQDGQGRRTLTQPPALLVLSVDGWCRVINAHPQFDGMSFLESEANQDGLPEYIECSVYRKDRRAVTRVREYMCEANTGAGAWLTHPRRMLRHRAMVQCARVCFGLGGLLEHEEAQRSGLAGHLGQPQTAASVPPSGRYPLGAQGLKDWLGRAGAP